MPDCKEFNNEDWKTILRSELITGILGNQQEKNDAFAQIGYYYTCFAPAFLYKYYSDDPQKLETVKLCKMWYSAPCNFNDVFDCDISIDEQEVFNSALQMAPDKRGIRSGSPMWRQLKQTVGKEIRSLRTTFDHMKTTTGIACLSESDDSLLMWAHYANNHSGICVEYELLKINQQLHFSPIPVIYSNERPSFRSISQNIIRANSTSLFIEGLSTKSPEWGYEKEWRIIRDDSACGINWDTQQKGALLDMIRPASVILGCMAKPEFESTVHEYCKEFKVNFYKMEKAPNQYQLNRKSILEFDTSEN